MRAKEPAEFFTVTCLQSKAILEEDKFKDIIIDSLRFLTRNNRVTVYAFVIMHNHLHMIWQRLGDHNKRDVQRDFLKFTGQQILKQLRNQKSPCLNELYVGAKDRKYQVWERNAFSMPIYTDKFLYQKLEYIHYNPVQAGLCRYPEEYKYSSAGFYYNSKSDFDFLTHVDG
jgi:putative transposase